MNPIFALFNLGGGEIILILAVVLLMFGAKKLPELARGLGQGIKEFKKATSDMTNEMHTAMNEPPSPPARKLPPAATVAQEPEHTSAPAATVPSQKA
ncbi:MAG TPA: twin-arginine translocase TatA/TatE family subunit [Verrucomicrobiae bacterium]|jgi:sec-independent protein translocase protein TatA